MKIENSFWKNLKIKDENLNKVEKLPFLFDDELSNKKKLIEVKNLSIEYKNKFKKEKKVIFENVSFNIYENEFVALLGNNGAGKTTLVEIISGIKKQTNGEVVFHYKSKEQDKLGIQFQDLNFPRGLSVKDILLFQLKITNKIDLDFLKQMLKTFKIDHLINMKISKLSGGQQQRLNVIIALMNKPKVIFLDEFTTGLDIAIKNEIKNFIMKFCKENKISVVLISHDMDIITQMCNHFIVLANKEIVVNCSKKTILEKFDSISQFLEFYIK